MAATVIARVPDRTVRDRRWDTLRRAAATRLAPFGAAVLLLAVAAALLAPVVAPHDPLKQDLNHALGRPDRVHPLGTDNVGRDVLSRVIWGTRVSLVAGFGSVVIAVVVGGVLGLAAVITRTLRSSMLEALSEDYIRTARAKGLTDGAVVRRHALRNALIPVVTVLGLQLGTLIGGAVITEYVFALPGVGRLVVDAIFARDYPLVQGVVLLIAVTFIAVNLAVDLLYGWIDPRIRYR